MLICPLELYIIVKQDSANNSTRFVIRQKLAASGIIQVWAYEKVGRVIQLESESNTYVW